MSRQPNRRPDPFESRIESALDPDRFITYGNGSSFVSGLEEVEAEIAELARSEPTRAASLYETFLAGCFEKAEEIDDSGGSFGQFAGDLFCAWIKARQAAREDPDETASRLLAWMDNDPYGFCYQMEKEVAEVLDRAGLAAFERQVRARFDSAAQAAPPGGGSYRDNPEYARRGWGEVLRALYVAQKDIEAYMALTEETDLTAQDCHAVATLLAARRELVDALVWVDRGVELAQRTPFRQALGRYELERLRRELLVKLGRGDEALEAAWAEYRQHPSKYSYDDLLEIVPEADRAGWHEKAMEAADDADLRSLIELFVETGELQRLGERLRVASDEALEALGHHAAEPAAEKLEDSHPEVAARLWRAQGMRIVNAKKSRYYDAALANFERARRCFERAELVPEWERTVTAVRGRHHRKTSFMPGFEAIIAGGGPSTEPSFLERAKARWGGGQSADG